MRKEYTLTDIELKEIYACATSGPVIYGNNGIPLFRTPQEKANSKWREFGDKYGFIWDTVRPTGKGDAVFTAEEIHKGGEEHGEDD